MTSKGLEADPTHLFSNRKEAVTCLDNDCSIIETSDRIIFNFSTAVEKREIGFLLFGMEK